MRCLHGFMEWELTTATEKKKTTKKTKKRIKEGYQNSCRSMLPGMYLDNFMFLILGAETHNVGLLHYLALQTMEFTGCECVCLFKAYGARE